MSATLTTKRKSARDRPRQVMREWGGLGRESGRSTEELVVRRPARDLRVQTHAPRRAVPDPHASRAQPGRACFSPLHARHCAMHVAAVGRRPRALAQPVAAAAARGAAPSPPRLSLLLSLLRKAPPVLHLWLQLAGTCVARAHACVRYGAWAGCGAHSESTSSIASPPPRQPLLSGHKND